MKTVKILNVPFDVCTRELALRHVMGLLHKKSQSYIVTPNPEMLLAAQKNKKFREILENASLRIPDGIGILWASTFNSIRPRFAPLRYIKAVTSLAKVALNPSSSRKIFPERVTGVDLMEDMIKESRIRKTPLFLLGAGPGVAHKVKKIVEKKYPGVNIVGTHPGSPDEGDFTSIQAQIAEMRPEILFVAYGAPTQELWIAKHLPKLKSVKVAMGVGGAFDFIAGVRKRAPEWMQKIGLEWLYRVAQEPKRIARIYKAVVRFPLEVIRKG